RSRTCSARTGRPTARLEPCASTSSGASSAAAQATTSRTASGVSRRRTLIGASEPRQVGKGELSLVHMHAPELGAAMQDGEDLPRIEQVIGVEGALHPLLLLQIRLGEHFRHEIALLDPDAVLAGEHAADLDAEPEDVRA